MPFGLLAYASLLRTFFAFKNETMETIGLEPTTSGLQSRRSPS